MRSFSKVLILDIVFISHLKESLSVADIFRQQATSQVWLLGEPSLCHSMERLDFNEEFFGNQTELIFAL